jgi:hypothetical protein
MSNDREAFEVHFAEIYRTMDFTAKDDSYYHPHVQARWEGWQAAQSRHTAEIELHCQHMCVEESKRMAIEQDRDEWRDSTIMANQRFEIAENEVRQLREEREALEKVQVAAVEFIQDGRERQAVAVPDGWKPIAVEFQEADGLPWQRVYYDKERIEFEAKGYKIRTLYAAPLWKS